MCGPNWLLITGARDAITDKPESPEMVVRTEDIKYLQIDPTNGKTIIFYTTGGRVYVNEPVSVLYDRLVRTPSPNAKLVKTEDKKKQ